MNVLSKLDVLKKHELKKQLVEVPEWGGSLWVQEMTGESRAEYDVWLSSRPGIGGLRFRIVIATVVDESGKPLFTDLDIPDLMTKSAAAIERLAEVGAALSGLGPKRLEEKVKNSEAEPSDVSPSGSAKN